MNITSIKSKAKELKVKNYTKMAKNELVWSIQKAEGHTDCFKKIPDCGQADCCFRDDCI